MSRALRWTPPLLVLVCAVTSVFLGLVVFGFPGPCSNGGLLEDALQNHQGIQDFGALLTFFGGWLVAILSVVWLMAVGVVRLIQRA